MIARKSLLIVISHFIIEVIGWIGLVVLAKLWGSFAPEALGIIGFAMSFLGLFNIVADLGFSQAHIKRVSEGKDLGTCIGTFAVIKLVLTCLMVTIIFIAIFIWKNLLHGGFYDATTESIIFVFILYYIFSSLSAIPGRTFIGTKEIAKREISFLLGRSAKFPLVILVATSGATIASISPIVAWPGFLQPIQQFIASHAIGSLAMTYVMDVTVALLIGVWLLRKYPLKKPDWELLKSYFTFAMPIMILSFISVISVNIDKVMIGYFWTSVEVGYYFTVQQVITIIMVLYTAVTTVLFPTLSEYHSAKNFKKIKQTTHLAERYISMILIPPIVVIIVFVRPVIDIMLSSAFLPAAPVLIVLTIYAFILGTRAPFISLISGLNRPDITAKIGVVICVTNIILNYLFIPPWGLLSPFGINGPTGAAVATVLSTSLGFFGFRLFAKKLTDIRLLQSHTPRHIIAGVVIAGVLYSFNILITIIHWYHLIIFAGLGLAVYLAVLFVLKEFKKQDLEFFLDMLRPKEMLRYISSELKEKPKKPN